MYYLRTALTDWRENGVLTVAQIEARESGRKSQKGYKRGNKDPGEKSPRPSSGKYDIFICDEALMVNALNAFTS